MEIMALQNIVAVITRTKNRTLLLGRAVESVLGQTHTNWQHVIVNDGGDPEPVNQLLQAFQDQYKGRLTVIHNVESLGMEAASNIGIKASDSKFVVVHDDDDSWEPEFLQRCLEEYEKCPFPTVKGVLTHITQIFERLETDSVIEERRQDYDNGLVAVSIPQISEINQFFPISFLFERSVFDEIGYFDESLTHIGDWDFNIRFLMKYDVLVIKENLANYHIRTDAKPNYENTVTADRDAHQFYRALLVNKYIREDLEKGQLSRGAIFAYGDYFHRTSGNMGRIVKFIDKLKELSFVSYLRRWLKK